MTLEEIKTVFDYLGYGSTLLVIAAAIYALILWLRGIFPVLIRLGNGLAKRKIAIFAKGDSLTSLEKLLHDSTLFDRTNILKIPTINDIGIAEQATLFVVYWPDWKDNLTDILRHKIDGTALVVYAPQEHGFIPKETMVVLDQERNVVVNNFRGRLLNDIVACMITTSYEKK